jgi:acyl-CoA thioesterase-1
VRHFVMALLAALALGTTDPAAAQAQREIRIVALGDSLTAGYQLPPGDAFPVKLQAALRARGHAVAVDNAGVSGDTSTGGLERLDWAVGEGVDAVILELGANDALRGIDPDVTRRSLDEILTRLKARGIPVLVAGMLAPPNLGHAYGEAFGTIFPQLAEKHGALLYPFFLDGVAATAGLNLADGMHPNARGVDVIVERILPKVEELIAVARARPRG